MNQITNFIQNSRSLTKNPLGIIGLFISLIYGFSCLVLGTSISNLKTCYERLPLIWFIIIFPFAILAAFVYLVINYHEHLYAPGDFRNDRTFYDIVKNKGKNKKREEEFKELEEAPENETHKKTPEKKVSKGDIEVSETRKDKKSTGANLVDIYKNIEKWSLEELHLQYHADFKEDQTLAYNNQRFEADAIGVRDKRIYLVEIKYWKNNKSTNALKKSLKGFLDQSKALPSGTTHYLSNVKFIIVLVFDSLESVDKWEFLQFAKNIYPETDIHFYEYKDLEEAYG